MSAWHRLGGACLGLLLFASAAAEQGSAVRPLVVPPELALPPSMSAAAPSPAATTPEIPPAATAVVAADPAPPVEMPALPRRALPAPLTIDAAKAGYAFETPAVLVRQLVFGIAHGVTLLARACLDDQEDVRRPTQAAYEEWLVRHGERLIDAESVLARYYFGARAVDASEDDIARALNLPPQLELRHKPEQLREACASFPEALAKKRYDLDLVFATHRDEQRLARALEVRESVAQCRQIAEPGALAQIDASFARWQTANAKIENASRERWLRHRGELKDLDHWQADVRTQVRRSFTGASVDPQAYCATLIKNLDAPEQSLASLVGDPKTLAEVAPVDAGEFASE